MNDYGPEASRAYKTQWQRLALPVVFILALWGFLRLFSSILTPFVVAAGLAYFLDPAVTRLNKIGIHRPLGTFIILATAVLVFVAFILVLYPVIESQAVSFATNLPAYIKTAQSDFGKIVTELERRL